MKYSLTRDKKIYSNAGSKAVRDCNSLAVKFGYTAMPYETLSANKLIHNLKRLFFVAKIFFTVKKDDVCFMQWPTYSDKDEFLLYRILKSRGCHLQLLVHDLTSMRTGKNANYEQRFLELAKTLIVHTPAMREFLIARGVDGAKMKILTSFDYLINDKGIPVRRYSKDVVFAGNLAKSTFLAEMMKKKIPIRLFCYGKEVSGLKEPLFYKGQFDSEDVFGIEGSWGLVWDGDSTDTCSGMLGEYLKLNAPHKVSLYVVACLPIIIWSQAAMADYVIKKGLGIKVDSLESLPDAIMRVSENEYARMIDHLKAERQQLIVGVHLRKCLEE